MVKPSITRMVIAGGPGPDRNDRDADWVAMVGEEDGRGLQAFLDQDVQDDPCSDTADESMDCNSVAESADEADDEGDDCCSHCTSHCTSDVEDADDAGADQGDDGEAQHGAEYHVTIDLLRPCTTMFFFSTTTTIFAA